MLNTIAGALGPVILALALGYYGGWRKMFSTDHAAALNRMVLNFTLPLSLFAGIVCIPRRLILASGPLLVLIVGGLVVTTVVTYLVARYAFKRSITLATLQALAVGNPSVPFVGTTVLGFLFGHNSALAVSLSSLTINVILLPAAIILLAMDGHHLDGTAEHRASGQLGHNILKALRKPVVLLPLLALVLSLLDIKAPQLVITSFHLLGTVTGGAAMFAAGILLYSRPPRATRAIITTVTLRVVIVPVCILITAWLIGAPALFRQESVVALSMPCASIVVILANQIQAGEQEANSALFLSTVASLFTMAFFIAVTA